MVTLAGWVDNIRNMGKFGFLTVRDRYGITQISLDDTMMQSDTVQSLHYEDCIQISWVVTARPAGQENLEMSTGAIEIVASEIMLMGKSKEIPFQIVDDPATSEEQRFKHRYLDLRRKKVLNTVMVRAKMNHYTRNRFTDQGFLEVQTPLFTVSSPEGARDYLIPSRVNPGKCYALPQAPQQYKQLLMIGGIDKYFQIAPCFRDEDPRADRHSCEFYQIDVEMSFVHQEDVHAVAQQYIQDMVPQICAKRIIDPVARLPFLAEYILPWSSSHFPKIPYDVAMELFGSDKPDLRFDGHMIDVTELFRASEASFIATPLSQWAVFKAILLKDHLPTRKEIDAMTDIAKQAWAWWLPYIQLDWSELKGSIAKFIDTTTLKLLVEQTGFADGDTLLFVLGTSDQVAKVGNKIRMDMRDRFHLVDTAELAFAWIVNFPFLK
jgi:aspartyl-tRNA synthetase